jgi:hypothetical protein
LKRIRWLTLGFILLWSTAASAETILTDDFSTLTQVNTGATTAYYNAPNTWYQLPKIQTPQGIGLAEYGNEYAVMDGGTIKFFQYNSGSNSMINAPNLNISVTNPLGLAMRKDERSLWVFSNTDVKRYDFDGTGMVYNPNLSVLGLNGVISVASQPYQDSMAVLARDSNNKGVITYYQLDSNGNFIQNPLLSFNTGITNPLNVSLISGSPDLVVTDSAGSHYFSYANGTGYTENAGLSKYGLSNATGSDEHDSTLAVMENGKVNRYLYDGSKMNYSSVLSANNTDQAIALSTRSDNYDFAYVTDTGNVNYYTFNGTNMVLNPYLSTTGLSILGGYYTPRRYQSVAVNASKPCDLVRLTTTEQDDAGSSIQYSISSDGGSTWTSITGGGWNQVPIGTQFIVRADLQTANTTSTPRLLDVKLEATKVKISNLQVTNILFPAPGQTYPTSTFPFYVRAGSEFTFQVDTDGYVENLTAVLSNGDTVTMNPKNPISDEQNVWWGRYTPSVTEGTGTAVVITLMANFQTWSGTLTQNPFYITNGTVSMTTGIKLVH